MIPGVESLYQRIADAMTDALPEGWSSAEFHAMFFPKSSCYEAEYVLPDGVVISFQPTDDGSRAIREMRRLFHLAGKPLWCQVWFLLSANGSFTLRWGYDGCDTDGNLPFDEEAAFRRL